MLNDDRLMKIKLNQHKTTNKKTINLHTNAFHTNVIFIEIWNSIRECSRLFHENLHFKFSYYAEMTVEYLYIKIFSKKLSIGINN